MTEMSDIKLSSQFIRLAELMVGRISTVEFSPIEAKLLFNLTAHPEEISNFHWDLKGNYVKGHIKEQVFVYPPKFMTQDYLSGKTWHPHAMTAAILQHIESKLGSVQMQKKMQQILFDEFEHLTMVQAKALIKRNLDIDLTSLEKNEMTMLRRTMESYEKMITALGTSMHKQRIGEVILDSPGPAMEVDEYLNHHTDALHFKCWECNMVQSFPDTKSPMMIPMHHNLPMSLNIVPMDLPVSGKELLETKLELDEAVKKGMERLEPVKSKILSKAPIDLSNYLQAHSPDLSSRKVMMHDLKYYCPDCDEYSDIPTDLKRDLLMSYPSELPKHKGKDLQIRIVTISDDGVLQPDYKLSTSS
ncbi:MAG: hypothetical protein INQ03_08080 [Candidatus Heimdallarchaeota archaeon]|nr:hypothetical protein [Candidatus Heimdallarchaeota archaeon]